MLRLPAHTPRVFNGKLSRVLYSTSSTNNPSTTIQSTSHDNGIQLTTLQSSDPVARLSLVINAGSRFETGKFLGISSFVRAYAFKNNHKRTGFRTVKEVENLGAFLSTEQTRENLILSAQFLPEDLPHFLEIFSEYLSHSRIAHYELNEVTSHIKFASEKYFSNPFNALFDALHRVAFRTGLGNSVFPSASTQVTPELIKEFIQQHFVSPKIALVASGVSHDQLLKASNVLASIPKSSVPASSQSNYFGGDSRIDAVTENAHFILGFKGVSQNDSSLPAMKVLTQLINGQSNVKWGSGISPLAQASQKMGSNISISSFQKNYSDAGLIGFYCSAPAGQIEAAVQTAINELKKIASSVSEGDVKRAISLAKLTEASNLESTTGLMNHIYDNLFPTLSSTKPLSVLADLDKVKVSDVTTAAQNVLNSKPSAVALGHTNSLPYSDSFKY